MTNPCILVLLRLLSFILVYEYAYDYDYDCDECYVPVCREGCMCLCAGRAAVARCGRDHALPRGPAKQRRGQAKHEGTPKPKCTPNPKTS